MIVSMFKGSQMRGISLDESGRLAWSQGSSYARPDRR